MPLAMLRTMLQFGSFAEVDILETYHPSEAEVSNPSLYAANVRELIAKHLGIHVTDHTFEDATLVYTSQAHVGFDVEMSKLKLLGYDTAALTVLYRYFERLDRRHAGALDGEDLRAGLARGDDNVIFARERSAKSFERLFRFFDTDRNQRVVFREFMQVVATLPREQGEGEARGSAESRQKLAFLLLDVGGLGQLQRSLLEQVLAAIGAADASGASTAASMPMELDFKKFQVVTESYPEVVPFALRALRVRLLPAGNTSNAGNLSKKDSHESEPKKEK